MTITFLADQTTHVLMRLATHPNGDQEWGCGECGHTRLINFDPPPDHKNICTQVGDFSARHCMGSSCAPELDAAVRLDLTARGGPEGAFEPDPTPRTYASCGIRRKVQP